MFLIRWVSCCSIYALVDRHSMDQIFPLRTCMKNHRRLRSTRPTCRRNSVNWSIECSKRNLQSDQISTEIILVLENSAGQHYRKPVRKQTHDSQQIKQTLTNYIGHGIITSILFIVFVLQTSLQRLDGQTSIVARDLQTNLADMGRDSAIRSSENVAKS